MRNRNEESGFTLIELMTVIAIIAILVGIAVPQYKVAIIEAKEAALVEDVNRMNEAIQQYYVDKQAWPQSLDDLQSKGYLARIPVDPITRAADWVPVTEQADPDNPSGATPGITGVHSASDEVSLSFEGKKYSEIGQPDKTD